MKKKMILIISALFYICMFILTIKAEDIHMSRLPKVTAQKLSYKYIEYIAILEDGTPYPNTKKVLAIPKEIYESGQIFVIITGEERGLERSYAKKAEVKIGISDEQYYEVISGLNRSDYVIIEGYEELSDMQEVNVIE